MWIKMLSLKPYGACFNQKKSESPQSASWWSSFTWNTPSQESTPSDIIDDANIRKVVSLYNSLVKALASQRYRNKLEEARLEHLSWLLTWT
jgi:hypothetical protein